jgi:hypothetical protein
VLVDGLDLVLLDGAELDSVGAQVPPHGGSPGIEWWWGYLGVGRPPESIMTPVLYEFDQQKLMQLKIASTHLRLVLRFRCPPTYRGECQFWRLV